MGLFPKCVQAVILTTDSSFAILPRDTGTCLVHTPWVSPLVSLHCTQTARNESFRRFSRLCPRAIYQYVDIVNGSVLFFLTITKQTYIDVCRMKYTLGVIYESLRLFPPVAFPALLTLDTPR